MADKEPTISVCILSGKKILQSHVDDNLVIQYGKGMAFVTAIQDTVKEPSENPIVFSSKQLSAISLPYKRYSFPARIEIENHSYKSFPQLIYVQNQLFKFNKSSVYQYFKMPDPLKDDKVESGVAIYVRVKQFSVDKSKE